MHIISDSSDLIFGHPETVRQEYVAKKLALGYMELAFLGIIEQAMLLKLLKDLLDMLLVVIHVFRVDEDVIEVDDNTDVQQVSENGVNKMLESSRSVCQSFRNDIPLVRAISGVKCSFPLVTISDPYKMVCMAEVELCIDRGFAQSIEQVGDERKWVSVLLGDLVKTPKVYTQA
uniref:Uncharacterized protein n=1 Tax=Moniliophthora roreri TaxID=221103 RepID=A0A0W0GFU7_MONRR